MFCFTHCSAGKSGQELKQGLEAESTVEYSWLAYNRPMLLQSSPTGQGMVPPTVGTITKSHTAVPTSQSELGNPSSKAVF